MQSRVSATGVAAGSCGSSALPRALLTRGQDARGPLLCTRSVYHSWPSAARPLHPWCPRWGPGHGRQCGNAHAVLLVRSIGAARWLAIASPALGCMPLHTSLHLN